MAIVHPVQWHWRYKIGDPGGASARDYDDSGWSTRDGDSVDWGSEPVAWVRAEFTVPQEIDGISLTGSRITFKCSADDDGVIYLNGMQMQKFHWDQGNTILIDKALPGQRLVIAIKGINTGGPGSISAANIEYSALDSIRADVKRFLDNYQFALDTITLVDSSKRSAYWDRISKVIESIDISVLRSKKNDIFLASISAGESQIKQISGELSANLNVHLVGHSHIDFAYLWLWPETIGVCENTFTTVSKLMDDYPGFVMSQSQPALYEEMQRSAPDVFDKIKERVKRGQWDVSTATTWSEGDTNLSSGEAIVRSILYGKRYIMQQFGIEPTVCWEPDNFGHAWTLPQILAKSGIKYYYFARRGPGAPLFWWQSPDGSRVLAYQHGHYDLGVEENELEKTAVGFSKLAGINDYMRVYGVGDHGGGPTRAQLDTAKKLQARTDYPKVMFDTAKGYFDTAAASGKQFPVVDTELNPIFEGCYTTHSDIKKWNRECENWLVTSEVFSSIASNYGMKYPGDEFLQSWHDTCFNEFHDILCGSAIHGAYTYAKQLRDEAVGQAKTTLDTSLKTLLPRINTHGDGVPIVVFNPLSWPRTDAVAVSSPFPDEDTHVRITDETGASYPGRTLGDILCFTARDVPALGYKVFWASRSKTPVGSGVSFDGPVIANQYFRVRIDPHLGVITGIFDKLNNRNVMVPREYSDVLQILLESSGEMSAWGLGKFVGGDDLIGGSEVVRMDAGPAKATVVFDHKYGQSTFTQEITLYDSVPRIDIRLTADWREPWTKDKPTPMLKAAFRADLKNPKATFEIPFGSIERPADGHEVVAQKWVDISDADYGLSLLNDSKYGFDVKGNTIRISLLRSPNRPDPTPEYGVYETTYSMYPHKGDWREAGTVRRGYELNQPLIARVTSSHSGELPASKSFLSISASNVVVTALKKAEDDDNLILRFYETNGQPCIAEVHTSIPVKFVAETDLLERPIGPKEPAVNGAFPVKASKYAIKTYKLYLR